MDMKDKDEELTTLSRRKKYILTAAIYLGYLTLGIGVCIHGPCLIDLAAITGSTMREITWVFTGSTLGGIIGSVLVPLVAQRCKLLIPIGIALLLNGIMCILLPWCSIFEVMVAVMSIFGMGKCFIDGSFTFALVDIWRLENAAWMQGLHFMFGLGSMAAPLIAKPFIRAGQETLETYSNSSHKSLVSNHTEGVKRTIQNLETASFKRDSNYSSIGYFSADQHEWTYVNSSSAFSNNTRAIPEEALPSKLHWAYLIVGLLFVVAAVTLITVGIVYKFIWKVKSHKPKTVELEGTIRNIVPPLLKTLFVGSLFFYVLAGLMVEYGIFFFFFTFAVKAVHMDKDDAVMLMFSFSLSYTLSRGACALLACCLKPKYILSACVTIVATSSLILMLLYETQPVIVWACTIGIAISIGPFFAPAITYFNLHQPMTPFVGGMTQLASTLGALFVPSLSGLMYPRVGSAFLVYILFSASIVLVLCFISLLVSGYKIQRFKKLKQNAKEEVIDILETQAFTAK